MKSRLRVVIRLWVSANSRFPLSFITTPRIILWDCCGPILQNATMARIAVHYSHAEKGIIRSVHETTLESVSITLHRATTRCPELSKELRGWCIGDAARDTLGPPVGHP